jgi:hypothetical protein
MIRLKAINKKTGKKQLVLFIDWETHFIKLKDGQLTDFKHQNVVIETEDKIITII